MASLQITNIPDELMKKLQHLAGEHGRALNEEIVQCLADALAQVPTTSNGGTDMVLRARNVRGRMSGVWVTEDTIRAARDEGRA